MSNLNNNLTPEKKVPRQLEKKDANGIDNPKIKTEVDYSFQKDNSSILKNTQTILDNKSENVGISSNKDVDQKNRFNAKNVVMQTFEGKNEAKTNVLKVENEETVKKEIPIHIEPLTPREKKEINEAFKENKFSRPNYEASLVKQHENKLNRIPDKVNGQSLSNMDKFKLLAGDTAHVNSQILKVESERRISIENGKDKQIVTNLNSDLKKGKLDFVEKDKGVTI